MNKTSGEVDEAALEEDLWNFVKTWTNCTKYPVHYATTVTGCQKRGKVRWASRLALTNLAFLGHAGPCARTNTQVRKTLRKAFRKLVEVNKCQAVWTDLTSNHTWNASTLDTDGWKFVKKCELRDHVQPQ